MHRRAMCSTPSSRAKCASSSACTGSSWMALPACRRRLRSRAQSQAPTHRYSRQPILITAGESMSFILDALKKSESDRQRQNGPALFEVRVAPPRTRLPLWAIAIALLLLVNLAIVMWMLMRHQTHVATADVSATTVTGAASAGAAAGTPTPALGASIAAPNPALAGTSAQLPTLA